MKVGDSVIVIDVRGVTDKIDIGDIGTIKKINPRTHFIIKWDKIHTNPNRYWYAKRFKKYERKIINWRQRIR